MPSSETSSGTVVAVADAGAGQAIWVDDRRVPVVGIREPNLHERVTPVKPVPVTVTAVLPPRGPPKGEAETRE